MKRITLAASDGVPLQVYASEPAPTKSDLLLAMPFGARTSLLQNVVDELTPHFNVHTWEPRYVMDKSIGTEAEVDVSFASHGRDAETVIRGLGLERFDVLGYCAGAAIALWLAGEHPARVKRLFLVNGEYAFLDGKCPATQMQRDIDRILPIIASGRKKAQLLCRKFTDAPGKADDPIFSGFNEVYTDPEHLYRFARNYLGFRGTNFAEIAGRVQCPVFAFFSESDTNVAYQGTVRICGLLRNSTLVKVEDRDHYDLCRKGSTTLRQVKASMLEPCAALG